MSPNAGGGAGLGSGGCGGTVEVVGAHAGAVSRAFVEEVVAAVRAHTAVHGLHVCLNLCGDAEIGRLHGEYLGDPKSTDVITFDHGDGSVDLAVSVETARREARARGHDERAEIALYIVHGMLHAAGHDDHEPAERARMRAAEGRILAALGLSVAPVDE